MSSWRNFYILELEFCKQLLSLADLQSHSQMISFVYNPLDYASEIHCLFLERYFNSPAKVLFVGMNPGPYGMAQTGVPFGDVRSVLNWMKINGSVMVPSKYHSKKPIKGLKCTRNEVSGERFWGFFNKRMKLSPESFFKHAFVVNMCPLLFLDKNGKNLALSNLPTGLRIKVENICKSFVIKTIEMLESEHVVCVGRYVYDRVKKWLKDEEYSTTTSSTINDEHSILNLNEGKNRKSDVFIKNENVQFEVARDNEISNIVNSSNQFHYPNIETPQPLFMHTNISLSETSSLSSSQPPSLPQDNYYYATSLQSQNFPVLPFTMPSSLQPMLTPSQMQQISSPTALSLSSPPTILPPSSSPLFFQLPTSLSPAASSSLSLSSSPIVPSFSSSTTPSLLSSSSLSPIASSSSSPLIASSSSSPPIASSSSSSSSFQLQSPSSPLVQSSSSSSSPIKRPKLGFLMHPSPANPQANKGWDDIAFKQLREMDLLKYFT